MIEYVVLPGIGGSGPQHWQSIWEKENSAFKRFQPGSWDQPELRDWIAALERAIAACETPPVLVVHSLACLLVAHWQATSSRPVAGAFLVSVPDPRGPAFPAAAAEFDDVPTNRFRFPSLIVASGNDPFGSPDYMRRRAAQWGSSLVDVGNLGHINGSSGLGLWPQGMSLLSEFALAHAAPQRMLA